MLIERGFGPKEMKGSNLGILKQPGVLAWRVGLGGHTFKRKYTIRRGLEGNPQSGQLSDRCQKPRSSSSPKRETALCSGSPCFGGCLQEVPFRWTHSGGANPISALSACVTLGQSAGLSRTVVSSSEKINQSVWYNLSAGKMADGVVFLNIRVHLCIIKGRATLTS